MLKNKELLKCTPIEFIEQEKGHIFKVNCNGRERSIPMDKVSGLEVVMEESETVSKRDSVVFKLTGNLAKNYGLRENEKMVMNSLPEYITVSNNSEALPLLMARLLRYGNLCEVQYPSGFRDSMAETINKTLANYGE
jgi:hypothetical protein